jgi:hypothetical protein
MTNVHDWTRPPVQRRKKSKLFAVVLISLGVFVLLVCGAGGYLILSAPTRVTASNPNSPMETPLSRSPLAPAPAQKVKGSISDGEWTAGADFSPGPYETTTQSSTCVWQVTTGEGDSVQYIDPGHVGPGHYKFTFKAGQTLHTLGCGTWVKR